MMIYTMTNIGIMIGGILLFLFILGVIRFLFCILCELRCQPEPEPSCDNCKNYAVCAAVAATIQEYNMPEKCCAYWQKERTD